MIYIESGLFVRVEELSNGPKPLPLASGFSRGRGYRVLGIYTASESAECFFILCNDRFETWFVSNRHFRIVGLHPGPRERLHLDTLAPDSERAACDDCQGTVAAAAPVLAAR